MTNLLDLMARNLSGVAFDPSQMVRELVAYGEPEAAAALTRLSAGDLAKISVRAGDLILGDLTIDKAICLATVEFLEGTPRALRRNRRNYKLPGL